MHSEDFQESKKGDFRDTGQGWARHVSNMLGKVVTEQAMYWEYFMNAQDVDQEWFGKDDEQRIFGDYGRPNRACVKQQTFNIRFQATFMNQTADASRRASLQTTNAR